MLKVLRRRDKRGHKIALRCRDRCETALGIDLETALGIDLETALDIVLNIALGIALDEAFEFIVGNPVSIKDMFRLSKYRKSSDTSSRVHVRPILVKISTAWERKLILLRKSRLRDFRTKHLFVREDVPPEHKLRQRRPKSRVESTVTSMPSTSNIPPTLPHSDDPHHCTHSSTPIQHRVFLLQVHRSLLP